MDLRAFAEELIQAVEGIGSEKNITEVVEILNTIKRVADENWEAHLAGETAETLMYDEILCSCGQLIEITRKRKHIDAKFV